MRAQPVLCRAMAALTAHAIRPEVGSFLHRALIQGWRDMTIQTSSILMGFTRAVEVLLDVLGAILEQHLVCLGVPVAGDPDGIFTPALASLEIAIVTGCGCTGSGPHKSQNARTRQARAERFLWSGVHG